MEETTKRKALLCIDKARDEEGRFACKAVGITMGVSKARASVILHCLAKEGYCLKGDRRDYLLLEKAEAEIKRLKGQAKALSEHLGHLDPRIRKELVDLLLSHGSEELIDLLCKPK